MQTNWVRRILIGFFFAMVMGLLSVTVGQAGAPHQEDGSQEDCQSCHESFGTHWEESAHGQAVTDPVFRAEWKEQGSPQECLSCHTTGYDLETGTFEKEGIACEACHSPVPQNHPEQIMPTDGSSRFCGTCHIDTHDELEVSVHGKEEMACVNCHNPHTTSLKAGSVQELCRSCHGDEVHFYSYTTHAQEGLLCTDCHLRVEDSPMGEGHGQREHTFAVDLESCNQCHGQEMHYPVEEAMTNEASPEQTSFDVERAAVAQEPEPSPAYNPFLLAGVGLILGILLTPWLERAYRRIFQGNEQ